MGRGSVKMKKVKVKGGGGAEDTVALNEMFSQITGVENADPSIITPKLHKLQGLLSKYAKIYNMLIGFNDFVGNFPEHKDQFDDIELFSAKIKTLLESDPYDFTKKSLADASSNYVNTVFKRLKDEGIIHTIVVTSGRLGKYSKSLEDKENLRDDFIKREPGLTFRPLSFTNLEFKSLWVSEKLTNMAKKYILNILSHTYSIGHQIYQLITSPNIDIKKFSKVLIDNIDSMKKRIPRCDKAFDVIANSVHLLEDNFDGYYKTSVEAENPSLIIESFIIDVSTKQKSSASITTQFRKIIMFMKRQSANNKDPRVAKLFKILNSQFDMMKQETGVEPDSDTDVPKDSVDEESEDEEKLD